MIYLDNAATTKVDERVVEEMMKYLSIEYGNPNGKYYSLAEEAKKAVNKSRKVIADYFDLSSEEIIFTSGATDSNNMVIKGVIDYNNLPSNHLLTTRIEHSSILEPHKYLQELGVNVSYLKVNNKGLICTEELETILKSKPIKILSICSVNNEIGTIQDIKKINDICDCYNVDILLDITQGIFKVDYDINNLNRVKYISFSGHKIYGPKGVGVLIIRKDHLGLKSKITPLLHGGDQETGYRSGTLAVHQIVGLGKAFSLMIDDEKQYRQHLSSLDIKMRNAIKLPLEHINNFDERVPGILSIRIVGHNNQILLSKAKNLFAASTGSACSNTKPSYVLSEIGVSKNNIKEIVRFSFGKENNNEEIEEILRILS